MENYDTLTEDQGTFLSTHDWNANPDYSAVAKRILDL